MGLGDVKSCDLTEERKGETGCRICLKRLWSRAAKARGPSIVKRGFSMTSLSPAMLKVGRMVADDAGASTCSIFDPSFPQTFLANNIQQARTKARSEMEQPAHTHMKGAHHAAADLVDRSAVSFVESDSPAYHPQALSLRTSDSHDSALSRKRNFAAGAGGGWSDTHFSSFPQTARVQMPRPAMIA